MTDDPRIPLNDPRFPGKTSADARAAFDRVCNTVNWKYPVNTVITCSEEEARFIRYAIEFFCGAGADYLPGAHSRYQFTHPGYYAVIGS